MTPDEHTIQETFVDVGNGHTLYVHEWGNSHAELPILYLHGGPGSGCSDRNKYDFDARKQRVIFFDQRGCGKSLPSGSIEHNTTNDLVSDIEKIADRLKLSCFVIAGGSWGSCLAFAYAIQHPHRIKAMVLHGIFTGTREELNWINHGGFREFFPEVWQEYLARTPKSHHKDPSAFHFKQAFGPDVAAAKASAYAYHCLEGGVLSLDDRYRPTSYDEYEPASTRIEMHYLANQCFLPENYIIDKAHTLIMPVWLVQGRYDFVCRPVTAYTLNQKLPNSELTWTVSGHRSEHETVNLVRTILLQFTTGGTIR